VQHQLAVLEGLGGVELQGLLFEHRSPVLFPASEDDRPYCDPVVVGQAALDEFLDERGSCVDDMSFPGSRLRRATIRVRFPFMILEFCHSVFFR